MSVNYFSKEPIIININVYFILILPFAGGHDGSENYDTILEYDMAENSIKIIGTMVDKKNRAGIGISVVKSNDFSMWWWCQ